VWSWQSGRYSLELVCDVRREAVTIIKDFGDSLLFVESSNGKETDWAAVYLDKVDGENLVKFLKFNTQDTDMALNRHEVEQLHIFLGRLLEYL
jgi:hypothetical protein